MKSATERSIIRSIESRPDINGSHRITLELDSGGPPISGRLHAGSGPGRPFTGWISLLAELEAAIETDSRQGDRQTEAGTPGQTNTEVRDVPVDQ